MVEIVSSVKNQEKGTHWELMESFMIIRQMNNCLLKTKREKHAGEKKSGSSWVFVILVREGALSL